MKLITPCDRNEVEIGTIYIHNINQLKLTDRLLNATKA